MTFKMTLANLRHRGVVATLLAVALMAAACSEKKPAESPVSVPAPAPSVAASQPSGNSAANALTDWLGTWTGPEGTHLKLVAKGDNKYEVLIKNLDGERSFAGSAGNNSGRIAFERDGKPEEIRPTDGNATGMKWLAGKKNCLTVREGEGYCRE